MIAKTLRQKTVDESPIGTPNPTELPALLTAALIRRHVLPCGKRSLQRYVAGGNFPRPDMKLPGKAFWRRETVLAWLDRQTQS